MPRTLVGRNKVIGGVICLMLGIFCQAQPAVVTPQTLADLKADRWTVRRNAFEHLATGRDAADTPPIQDLLIQLTEKENVESNKPDPDLLEDDDYVAYDEELTSLVEKIAVKTNNPRAWKALIYGRYNGDSVFGNWIAAHRETLPFLLRQLGGPNPGIRANAV